MDHTIHRTFKQVSTVVNLTVEEKSNEWECMLFERGIFLSDVLTQEKAKQLFQDLNDNEYAVEGEYETCFSNGWLCGFKNAVDLNAPKLAVK